MHPISLHQIIAPEISPVELVRIAGRLGCQHVCLWTQGWAGNDRFPVVEEADAPAVREAMTRSRISAYAVTSFPVRPGIDVAGYEAGLARGASLGASYASVQILDPEESRAIDSLGRLAALASRNGITASIEPMAYNDPGLLARTLRILDGAGGGAMSIDPLHIVRSATSLDELRGVDPSRIGYVQFCDGPLHGEEARYSHESAADRLPPGDGEFPLDAILKIVPAGRPISLEVPNEALKEAGVGAEARCGRAVAGLRRVLERNGRPG